MVENGAREVVLAGRDHDQPSNVGVGREGDHRYFDAVDTASHAKFFDDVFSDHPGIDTVVVAFGVLHDEDEVGESPQLGVEMAQVNYVGAVSALLHATTHLRERGGGQLIVLTSVAGITPRSSNVSYGSSKAGLDFLARGLARRYQKDNVRVLVVRPGFVHSSMTAGREPRPFAVSPEIVADSVVAALGRQANLVWVPGILKWVMGVLRMLPAGVVDRLER
jgi:decaprenylphospho-beta-D-erythro-pentofuranosid-2-ulose 2-reductase